MDLARVERLYRDYTVAAKEKDGTPVDLTGVDAALSTPPGTGVTGATTWTPATQVPNRYLLRGPTGALISTHTTFAAAFTAWQSAPAGSDIATEWTVLLAGPDATSNPAGTVVAPEAGADLFLRITDSPEVDVQKVERVNVT